MLIFDVLSTCDVPSGPPQPPQEGEPHYLESLGNLPINVENYQETYHDVTQLKKKPSVGLTWDCASPSEPELSDLLGLL